MKKTNNSDSMLGGVAGGMAQHFNIDPVISRLLWFAFLLASAGTAILIYVLLLLIMDDE